MFGNAKYAGKRHTHLVCHMAFWNFEDAGRLRVRDYLICLATYELPGRRFDKSLNYIIGRPRWVQVVPHGVGILNLLKTISEK